VDIYVIHMPGTDDLYPTGYRTEERAAEEAVKISLDTSDEVVDLIKISRITIEE
jgi:hypothetical protein